MLQQLAILSSWSNNINCDSSCTYFFVERDYSCGSKSRVEAKTPQIIWRLQQVNCRLKYHIVLVYLWCYAYHTSTSLGPILYQCEVLHLIFVEQAPKDISHANTVPYDNVHMIFVRYQLETLNLLQPGSTCNSFHLGMVLSPTSSSHWILMSSFEWTMNQLTSTMLHGLSGSWYHSLTNYLEARSRRTLEMAGLLFFHSFCNIWTLTLCRVASANKSRI